MTDDTIETNSAAPIPFPDKQNDRPEVVEDAPQNAAGRLRAFEDDVFGKDVPRINGQIERGHGSMFARLTHEQRVHHAALEHLVKTEQKVADTSAALAKAESDHAVALAAVDQAASHADAVGE